VSEAKFVGPGQVPKVDKFLDKTRPGVAECIAGHGGLDGEQGRLEMQFIVRDRSRAEGVEVLKVRGVSNAAQKCVRELLEGKWVGAPTADPAGVMFHYDLAPSS
jgi:hypothetical protein